LRYNKENGLGNKITNWCNEYAVAMVKLQTNWKSEIVINKMFKSSASHGLDETLEYLKIMADFHQIYT